MSTVVIGDVHGCLDELRELVRRCGVTPGPRVVLVGDLVAKGPDSAGVVQWAREGGVRAVLGNHDAHVLRLGPGRQDDDAKAANATATTAKAAKASKPPKLDHIAVAQTLGAEDWAWLEALPLWMRLPGGGKEELPTEHVVVHGGLVPGVALEDQKREHLLNLRSIKPDGEPSKRIEGEPWASRWRGPPHVVFGHDAVRGLQRHPWATGLDTGCVYGHELTALLLPDGKLVSVSARRAYASMK